MAPTLKLYMFPDACSLAPHIVLWESGLAFTAEIVDIRGGAPESLRKINPKMHVPVLVMDEEVITEVQAILTAISQLIPDRKLFGTTDLEIVRAYEWTGWLTSYMHAQVWGGLFQPKKFTDDESAYSGILAKSKKSMFNAFDLVEGRLKGLHAVGNSFTVVDAYLFVFWRWGLAKVGEGLEEQYPKYAALIAELVKRQSVKQALEAESLKAGRPEFEFKE